MAGKFSRWVLFALPLVWGSAASAATPAVPSESGVTTDPAEVIEPPSVTAGGAGTTSGITGSDMDQENEGSGSGQTRADDLFQTPAAAPDAGTAYETETPEPASDADVEQTLPDEPLGAADSGLREENENNGNGEPQENNGEPQASRGRNSE